MHYTHNVKSKEYEEKRFCVQRGELCGDGLRHTGERGGGVRGGCRRTDVFTWQKQRELLSGLQTPDEQEQRGENGADVPCCRVQVWPFSSPISHEMYYKILVCYFNI